MTMETKKQAAHTNFYFPTTERGYNDSVGASFERSDISNEITAVSTIAAKRNWGGTNLERSLTFEFLSEDKTVVGLEQTRSKSLPLTYAITKRSLDSLLFPTKGYVINAQVGGALLPVLTDERFVRVSGKGVYYKPLGEKGELIVRGEMGALGSKEKKGVPAVYLFRAGGDQSVRGYAYQELGVKEGDATVGGRYLATASAEYQYWFKPKWAIAAFYDAGNSADSFKDALELEIRLWPGRALQEPRRPHQCRRGIWPRRPCLPFALFSGIHFLMSDLTNESSSASPPPPPAKKRRWPRYLLIAVASLAVLLGGAFWFLGRESTLQLLVQKVASASGGQIEVSGVSGSLYNRMHLDHVSYRSKTQHITADNIDINWSPFQYFSEGIAISELHVASLAVQTTAKSDEPSTMPDSLASPFKIGISEARLDKITLIGETGNTVFEKMRFALSGDKTEWQLKDASAVTPFGLAKADANIAAVKPFKLKGTASLTQAVAPAGEKPAALNLALGGDLNLLNINAKGNAGAATADAQLALAPFDPVIILRSAKVKGSNINPGKFDATLPQADLSLDLDAAIGSNQSVSGKLAIVNHATPGPIDQQKLPLRQFDARLGGTLTATTLDSAIIDFGNAGKFTGSGKVDRDAPDAGIGQAKITLHTDKIDLQQIYSSINSTRIAGDITLDSDGKTQTVRAKLGEAKLRLDLEATLADSLVNLSKATLQAGKSSINATGQISLKDDQPFKAVASTSRLNPADFGAFPVADLNLDVRAQWPRGAAMAGQCRLHGPPQQAARPALVRQGQADGRRGALQRHRRAAGAGQEHHRGQGQLWRRRRKTELECRCAATVRRAGRPGRRGAGQRRGARHAERTAHHLCG